MTEFADAELRKAGEALSDARKLREADGSTPGAVDRAYFAAFHAARAVLSVRGTLPGDEDHLPAQFAEDIAIAEESSMEDAQLLNGLRAYRKKADYEHESVDADLGARIARAERLVDDVVAFC